MNFNVEDKVLDIGVKIVFAAVYDIPESVELTSKYMLIPQIGRAR